MKDALVIKEVRKDFTDALKALGVTRPADYYELSWIMKKAAGIPVNKKKSDMDSLELSKITAYEAIAYYLLNTREPETFEEIKALCRKAARGVYIATSPNNEIGDVNISKIPTAGKMRKG